MTTLLTSVNSRRQRCLRRPLAQVDRPPIADLRFDAVQLLTNDLGRLVGFSLLQCFADAGDDAETLFERSRSLLADLCAGLVEQGPSLRVTQDDPRNIGLRKLVEAG